MFGTINHRIGAARRLRDTPTPEAADIQRMLPKPYDRGVARR